MFASENIFVPATVNFILCVIAAGQQLAKQAIQEIVILPSLRPEVGKHITTLSDSVLFCLFL